MTDDFDFESALAGLTEGLDILNTASTTQAQTYDDDFFEGHKRGRQEDAVPARKNNQQQTTKIPKSPRPSNLPQHSNNSSNNSIQTMSRDQLVDEVRRLEEALNNVTKQAETEIQELNNQVDILDNDNAKAVETIKQLEQDLQNMQDDWDKSEEQLKKRVKELEVASALGQDTAEIDSLKQALVKQKKEVQVLKEKDDLSKQKLMEFQNKYSPNTNSAALEKSLEEAYARITRQNTDIDRLKQAIRSLNSQKKELEFQLQGKDDQGNQQIQQLERKLESEKHDSEALKREITALQSEKKILNQTIQNLSEQLKSRTNVKSSAGSSSEDALLKMQVVQLQAELESANVKIRRLVGAIKADRTQRDSIVAQLERERDEQISLAEQSEQKIISLLDLIQKERKLHESDLEKQETQNRKALDAARAALKNAEEQIKTFTQTTADLEQAITVKDQEIEKMKALAMKKKREAQNFEEDAKVAEDRTNKLIEAIRVLKEENQKLKSGTRASVAIGNVSLENSEGEDAQRAIKLEQACRKLRQMLKDAKEEAQEKEEELIRKLERAEERAKVAEQRARDAALSAITPATESPAFPGAFRPPPPPPPLPPPLKFDYDIVIRRTGQTDKIIGGQAERSPQIKKIGAMDNIIDAIRKGVTLKKTGYLSPELGDSYDGSKFAKQNTEIPKEEENLDDAFAMMAREIAANKKKREQEMQQHQEEKEKKQEKQGGELDNLLAELQDLEDLV